MDIYIDFFCISLRQSSQVHTGQTLKSKMFGVALSVGFSSVLVKIIVILVVAAASEASLVIVKLMIAFRLRKKGSAPLIYNNDIKIFAIRDTVRRLGSFAHAAIFMVALLAFAIFLPNCQLTSESRCLINVSPKTCYAWNMRGENASLHVMG